MRLRNIILILFFAIKLTACKDVEVNADIRMDPSFIQFLKDELGESKSGRFRAPNEDGSSMKVIKDNALKDHLPDLTSEGMKVVGYINEFEKRSKKKGLDSIRAITDHIDSKLKFSSVVLDPIVKETASKYISMLEKYFLSISKETFECKVDQEYVVLDMVNVAPLIRGNVVKKLLEELLARADDTSDDKKEILTSTLYTFLDNDKRQEMDYMCSNFKVCRSNPTFSDYLFQLLDESLKLENDKFHYFLTKCSQALLKKQSFFEPLLRYEIFVFLRKKMIDVPKSDVQELRKAITFLHSIVVRRYKSSPNNDKKIQIKAKSAYIILDIVDVSFGLDGNDLYGTQMEKTISSIIHWADETMHDNIEIVFYDLIQYIIEALNYNLTTRAREEITGLVDILFDYRHHDEPKKQNETDYLLTEGSKFIKGVLHPSKQKKSFL